MLDLKFVVNNPDIVKADLKKRGMLDRIGWVDELITLDSEQKKLQKELDNLRHERNVLSEEINKGKKQGVDVSKLVDKAKELPSKIKELEKKFDENKNKIRYYLMRIPNILDDSVPIGKDDTENVEVKKWGVPREFDFELKPHGVLAEELGIADFKRAAKVVGAGFVYLKRE